MLFRVGSSISEVFNAELRHMFVVCVHAVDLAEIARNHLHPQTIFFLLCLAPSSSLLLLL